MELKFMARSRDKGVLDVCRKIVKVETIKADEETIEDLLKVIALLKKLEYTIDN